MPTVQPSTSLSKKANMGMEEIIRGMRDLQIKLARLKENTSTNNLKNVSKQGYVQRCIWCDDASHTKKDCNEFNNMIWQGIICWKDGKIALKDREDLLQTNFEVLEIVKKEFHDVIIDSIKRKRQLMDETGMSHAIDARIYKDEEEVDIGYKQPTNEKNGYNQRHWARATIEVLMKVGDIEEPIVALVDHDSEINLMSKDLYKKQKWPIDMEHGWAIRAANNTWDELYRACLDVKIWIGDVVTEQHFFVQDTTSYPLILGQPYITVTQMETKVLDDGSAYARIVEIHSRAVYTILESFQAPEVTVETRYNTVNKKVKPVVGPLPEDSKEQMEEASKEASLRDPMSIKHQFTKETFEELKIGFDGSLLPEEITCFKKMLAKQGRSFAFESYKIGCVDPNIITHMVIFTVLHVLWNLRPIPVPRAHLPKLVELLK
uniref:Predicted protein n=1 Tax=Physcomitrium patens TaxID=3218 RepID=A9U5B8_PHYPA